jgi:hypothetical protein
LPKIKLGLSVALVWKGTMYKVHSAVAHFACRIGAGLALLTTTMAAQTTADWNAVKALTGGTEVRITVGSHTVHGEIDRATDDILVLTSRNGQEMFDRQQVSVLSVKKLSHRKRNTLIGLAAGTGVGLGIGIATRPKPGQLEVITPDAITAGFTAAGAIGGTLVGVIIPTGGWREVYKK